MITKLKSKEFFLSSTLALGVAAGVGIAAAPAQAVGFTSPLSTLEWDNGTSDFIDDAVAAFNNGSGSFDVTFSPASITGEAAVFIATGDFAPYFTPGTLYSVNGGSGATGTFDFEGFTPAPAPGVTEAEFSLDSLEFVFAPVDVPGATVTASLVDALFLGELIPDGSVEFELEQGEWDFEINDPSLGADPIIEGTATSSVMVFEQDALAPNGSYAAQGTVQHETTPEPTTILGLLAVGGLGLGLKRKK